MDNKTTNNIKAIKTQQELRKESRSREQRREVERHLNRASDALQRTSELLKEMSLLRAHMAHEDSVRKMPIPPAKVGGGS